MNFWEVAYGFLSSKIAYGSFFLIFWKFVGTSKELLTKKQKIEKKRIASQKSLLEKQKQKLHQILAKPPYFFTILCLPNYVIGH